MPSSSNPAAPTIADLYRSLGMRDLTLSLRDTPDGPKIALEGPKDQCTPKLTSFIREHREEIIADLSRYSDPARDIADSAPRPDDYDGPVPTADWKVLPLNPLVYGAAQGWEITARLGESLQFGEGATKEIALAAFAENIAADPFLTPSESAAFYATWGAETARLESEQGNDDAPELTRPNAAFGGAKTEAAKVVPAATVPAPVVTDVVSDIESLPGQSLLWLLEWRGTTAGPSMPPIAFVDDVEGFWREYNARHSSPA